MSKLILYGEDTLRQVLKEYGIHYHQERNYPEKDNALLLPRARNKGWDTNPLRSEERLGGLQKCYYREAA